MVNVDLFSSLERLAPEVETTLFRIVQESLTNIHKHSGSPTAYIHLTSDAESVFLEIRDEGRGLSPDSMHQMNGDCKQLGVGIAGMRERVRQIRGNLELISEQGTIVRAVIPLGGTRCQN
jgi:signal transduction histidine kinase